MKNISSFVFVALAMLVFTNPGMSICTKRETCVGMFNQCINKNVESDLIGEKRKNKIKEKCGYEWTSCLKDKLGCEPEPMPGESPSATSPSGGGSSYGSYPGGGSSSGPGPSGGGSSSMPPSGPGSPSGQTPSTGTKPTIKKPSEDLEPGTID